MSSHPLIELANDAGVKAPASFREAADGLSGQQLSDMYKQERDAAAEEASAEIQHFVGHDGVLEGESTIDDKELAIAIYNQCQADGVPLVNIVRRPEHVEQLRAAGAAHVVDSSDDSFAEALEDALATTGATIAFDAIGGGDLASTLLSTMERVASSAGGEFSRYGSATHKQVYVYGGLDRSPMVLRRDFGMSWGLGGWLLRPFLARIGDERAEGLRQRVAAEITTTFASSYGTRLSLADVVDPAQVARYGRMATGDKALVTPQSV